jgi:hypothetical protein
MTERPKLRGDLVLVEQTYRGEQSFIVKDPETRKYYRFRPVEIRVMQALDGEHTPSAAAAILRAEGIPVSAGAVEKFAAKLAGMGLCERSLAERSGRSGGTGSATESSREISSGSAGRPVTRTSCSTGGSLASDSSSPPLSSPSRLGSFWSISSSSH